MKAPNSSASKQDWVDYMRDKHGLDLSEMTKQEIIAKASDLEGMEHEATTDPRAGTANVSVAARQLRQQEKVTIRIPSTEGVDGKNPVFVGVNGVSFLIQRDMDTKVPISIVHALNDAQQTRYTQEKDGTMTPRKVHTYPFSRVG